jgi:hypothetical protein
VTIASAAIFARLPRTVGMSGHQVVSDAAE